MKTPTVTGQHFGVVLGALAFVVFVGALLLANARGDEQAELQTNAQAASIVQIERLTDQVNQLALDFAKAEAEAERAKAQANTSINQLIEAGEQPVITAPEIVTACSVDN